MVAEQLKNVSSLLPVEQLNPSTADPVTNGSTLADHEVDGEDGIGGMSKKGGMSATC